MGLRPNENDVFGIPFHTGIHKFLTDIHKVHTDVDLVTTIVFVIKPSHRPSIFEVICSSELYLVHTQILPHLLPTYLYLCYLIMTLKDLCGKTNCSNKVVIKWES
jgi:hypothetical protein